MTRTRKPSDRTGSVMVNRRDMRRLLGHLTRSRHFAQTLAWQLAEQNSKDLAVYRTAARFHHHRGGELEVDDGAAVSLSDGGAYVAAWVWVSDADLDGVEKAVALLEEVRS